MSDRLDGRGAVTVSICVQDWDDVILPTMWLRDQYDFDTPEAAAAFRQDWINFLMGRPNPELPGSFPESPLLGRLDAVVDEMTEEKLPEDLVNGGKLSETVAWEEDLDVPEWMREEGRDPNEQPLES